MDTQRYGIILNVEKYEQCVTFYQEVLQLKIMFTKIEGDFKLTCLTFGSGYLMIETEGYAIPNGKTIKSCPSKLRFNVPDIEATCKHLNTLGVMSEVVKNDWGSTINIYDPDGNRIGIRDEKGFKQQMNTYLDK